jgi:hypothetical protein
MLNYQNAADVDIPTPKRSKSGKAKAIITGLVPGRATSIPSSDPANDRTVICATAYRAGVKIHTTVTTDSVIVWLKDAEQA